MLLYEIKLPNKYQKPKESNISMKKKKPAIKIAAIRKSREIS